MGNIPDEVLKQVGMGGLLREIIMREVAAYMVDSGIADRSLKSYENKFDGCSEDELERYTSTMMLIASSVADGIARGMELTINLGDIIAEGGDAIKVIKDCAKKVTEDAIEVALDLPKMMEIPDLYNQSNRTQALLVFDCDKLGQNVKEKFARELGIDIDTIEFGKLVIGAKHDCEQLLEEVKGSYNGSFECDYKPNVDDSEDGSVNEMLEAARKAKGV